MVCNGQILLFFTPSKDIIVSLRQLLLFSPSIYSLNDASKIQIIVLKFFQSQNSGISTTFYQMVIVTPILTSNRYFQVNLKKKRYHRVWGTTKLNDKRNDLNISTFNCSYQYNNLSSSTAYVFFSVNLIIKDKHYV